MLHQDLGGYLIVLYLQVGGNRVPDWALHLEAYVGASLEILQCSQSFLYSHGKLRQIFVNTFVASAQQIQEVLKQRPTHKHQPYEQTTENEKVLAQ